MAGLEGKVHVGRTTCLLCRQPADAGSLAFDLNQRLFKALVCSVPCGRCRMSPKPSLWLHRPCYTVLEASYEKSSKPTFEDFRDFAGAVNPLYKPLNKEPGDTASVREGLFSRHTKRIMETCFKQELFGRLPLEIQNMILNFIGPCRYLIVLGESRRLIELLRNACGRQCERLGLTRGIYTTRIIYQGNSYISRIDSTPLEPQMLNVSDRQHQLKVPAHIKKIALSIDHVGVRQVQFMDQNSDPSPDGSPWYEVLEVPDSCSEARIVCDGLFVRSIRLLADHPVNEPRTWSSPQPPKFQPWNAFRVQDGCRLDFARLDNGVQGLLVCCYSGRNIGIHAFSGVTKSFRSFLKLMNQRPYHSHYYWIFFPINAGESIEAAWIRKFKGLDGQGCDSVLGIKTTLGRTATFGPHPPGHLQDIYEFRSLVRDGDGLISGIFHGGLDPEVNQVSEVGVICDQDRSSGAPKPALAFDTHDCPPTPHGEALTAWYMTKAPLDDLLRVRVCRDTEQPHRPCLGLLLYYQDQLVEAVGQIRWEQDLTQEVNTPLSIETGSIGDKNYIKSVHSSSSSSSTTRSEDDLKSSGWQELPRHGTLIWWFGYLGDSIVVYSN